MKEKNIGKNLISNLLFFEFIIVSSILLWGCSGSPKASPEENAEAKRFEPISDSAVVYIFHGFSPAGAVAALEPHLLYLDDYIFVGKFNIESFFRLVIYTGIHKLTVKEQRTSWDNTLSFKADFGKIYFIEMEEKRDKFGYWGPELSMLTDDSVAKSRIRGYTLLKTGVKQEP